MVHGAGGIPPQLNVCADSGNQALSPPSLGPGNEAIMCTPVHKSWQEY